MLAKQISGDAEKAPLLEKIARQTFRASEIVNSLLNFSRTSPTEFVTVDLNKVIRETLTLLDHQLSKAGVEVRLALDENLPRIKGNPGKLQQVFLNLFLNARDAMESGGILALSTETEDGLVKAIVADSGAGMSRENAARIFDPFFTTKIAKKGTGLGLSVSYGIVREHGGDIEVQSELGAGARFELSFPPSVVTKRAQPAMVEAPLEPVPVASMAAMSTAASSPAGAVATSPAVAIASSPAGAIASSPASAVASSSMNVSGAPRVMAAGPAATVAISSNSSGSSSSVTAAQSDRLIS